MTSSSTTMHSKRLPSRWQALDFWWRSRLLMALRIVQDARGSRPQHWLPASSLADAPVRVRMDAPLWAHAGDDEFAWVAGKVHNLRLVARAFDGIEIPAGAVLGFWRQLGRTTARRGFVPGREIRSGCVIPVVGGGICQFSNALATAASRAGFSLVECHAHSMRIDAVDRGTDTVDATVFWNYVDLRIRAPVDWRLEVKLDADSLRLSIRTRDVAVLAPTRQAPSSPMPIEAGKEKQRTAASNCLSCGETACFRHRSKLRPLAARTAWLLDGHQAEWSEWLSAQPPNADRMLPYPPRQWPGMREGSPWDKLPTPPHATVHRFPWTSLRRAWRLRRRAHTPGLRQASVIEGQGWLARAYARCLHPLHTHLVIDQGLLAHLQALRVLGGRSYTVLAHALPMAEIQHRLDEAARALSAGARATLADFRAQHALLRHEIDAWRGASHIVTPHADVADYARRLSGPVVVHVPWHVPRGVAAVDRSHGAGDPPLVVFPASALARKGAYELGAALQSRHARLRVLGSPSSDPALWRGIDVQQGHYADDWTERANVVVLPAHVEHRPRALLAALAVGVPVIASPACGLRGWPGVSEVPAGDVAPLAAALARVLDGAAGGSSVRGV